MTSSFKAAFWKINHCKITIKMRIHKKLNLDNKWWHQVLRKEALFQWLPHVSYISWTYSCVLMKTSNPSLKEKWLQLVGDTCVQAGIKWLHQVPIKETLINSAIMTVLLIALPMALRAISFDPFSCIKWQTNNKFQVKWINTIIANDL